MKKLIFILIGGTLVATCFFVFIFHRIVYIENVSIRIQEFNDSYRLIASHERYQTKKLEKYIEVQLHSHHYNNKNRVDGMITLDDHTSIYLQAAPGKLYIKLNKQENDLYS